MSHLLLTAFFLVLVSSSSGFSQNQQAQPVRQSSQDTITLREKSIPPDFENKLEKVLNYQFRADSLMKLADLYRKQLQGDPTSDKSVLRTKFSETEKLASINQKLANEVFGTRIMKDTIVADNGKTFSEIVRQKFDNQIRKDSVSQTVVTEKVDETQQKPTEIYSMFEVIPKPVYAATDKIPVNPEVPAGLIYRIQVAVFKNLLAPSYFKGITPVYGFRSAGSEVTNYYAGMFRKMSDASKALAKVKASGFKDAFVVALFDKKIVSPERAGVLEKEWGNKPFIDTASKQIQDMPKDTIPPILVFRVEVTRSQKPLNPDQLDILKRLAGTRGLEIIKNASGQNIYLIGKFLTFESAAEYTDLLTRNGQKDAKVAAYLGRREIPVETAKQLFEKY
jgi:hypothetical protein